MIILRSCCFAFTLKVGAVTLLMLYWWLSVTYLVLLIQYFYEHTVPVSILIGMIFLVWIITASVAMHGIINERNAYYVIPQIVVDALDCVVRFINLVYHLFKKELLIPRYTIFGSSWAGTPTTQKDDDSFIQMMYNLFDEKYPLPDVFAFIDLGVRLYFVFVLVSFVEEYRRRKLKQAAKKAQRHTAQPSPRTSPRHDSPQ